MTTSCVFIRLSSLKELKSAERKEKSYGFLFQLCACLLTNAKQTAVSSLKRKRC